MDDKTTNLAERITLRPAVFPDDEEFLVALYYTTRDDIQAAPIDEEQKKSLSIMQYIAQKQHYLSQFPDSKHDIILLEEKRAGRFWTMRSKTEILIVDLAIMPEYRNMRIGTFLLQQAIEEAARTSRVVNLSVLKTGEAAIRLYKRLGFRVSGEIPTHFQMRWQPENE